MAPGSGPVVRYQRQVAGCRSGPHRGLHVPAYQFAFVGKAHKDFVLPDIGAVVEKFYAQEYRQSDGRVRA